jgi:HPt (histidine-containing phosphotransfer) domain-containing protein
MPNYSLISLAAEIEFDVDDFIVLLELFLDTTDSNLIAISKAIKLSDSEVISANIHNIKGASMNLGLEPITELMKQMSLLNKKSFFADIEAIVNKCKSEIEDLRKLLEKS